MALTKRQREVYDFIRAFVAENGYSPSLEEIGPLCAAGADFIALGDAVFADPRGAAAALREASERLHEAEALA